MGQQTKGLYEFGAFRLDAQERLLQRDGAPISLTPKAFDLLLALVERHGRLVEKEELFKAVWPDTIVEESNLSSNIALIRKALSDGENGLKFIETAPKRGYRFLAEVRELRPVSDEDGRLLEQAAHIDEGPSGAMIAAPKVNARLAWIVAAALLLGLLAALSFTVVHPRQLSSGAQVTRLAIPLPKGINTAGALAPMLALSPDGRSLVFSASDGAGKQQLWLRSLNSFATQPLASTEGGAYPFWSPDSRHIAFFADNKLKKLDTESGVVEMIWATGAGWGGDWNRQGIILFANGERIISRVNAAGGQPEALTKLGDVQGETHSFPSFLPDEKHFLFQVFGGEKPGIYVGSLENKDRKLLIPLSSDTGNSTRAMWSPEGYILYALNRITLLAQAFDPDRLELRGEPFRVAENVVVTGPGVARFSVSTNGTLAFMQSGEPDTVQLTWRDRTGKLLSTAGPAAAWDYFRLSPDERLVAVLRNEPSRLTSIWLLDMRQGTTTRFVSEGVNLYPVWSPDGKNLAFSSARNSPPNLFLKPLAGNVPEERLLESRYQNDPSSWTPDGKFLIFGWVGPQTGRDIGFLPMSGERNPQFILKMKANERNGRVSPDGSWLAYQSDESGENEVYLTQFPQPLRSRRISTGGGTNPQWRADGKELYFVSSKKLMAVGVNSEMGFQIGTPQPLFEIESTYAPSKDGQRFLTSVVTEKAPAPPINVVLNWTADLKK